MIVILLSGIYLLMLLCSFFFSGTEAGFLSLNRERYHNDLCRHQKGTARIKALVDDTDTVLSTAVFGNNLANNGAGYIGVYLCILLFGQDHHLFTEIVTSVTVATTILLLFFGEVFPKVLFTNYTAPLLYRIGHLLRYFRILFAPVVFILTKVSDLLLLPASLASRQADTFSKRDVSGLLDDGFEEGLIDQEERFFFETVSSLSSIKAIEVMLPLADCFIINKKQDITAVLSEIKKSGREIIPIYNSRIDNIIGYVKLTDVFNSSRRRRIAEDFLIETAYVPETTPLDVLYTQFTKTTAKALIVVDEYGGCSGIVTENAIIERIFGFHYDLNAENAKEQLIIKLDELNYEVDTCSDIDELNVRLGITLPKHGYETLGGFINYYCGRIPKTQEVIRYRGITFKITSARKTAVDRVIIELAHTATAPENPDA